MIVHTSLWHTIKARNYTTHTLRVKHEISNSTIQRRKKKYACLTKTLLGIVCRILDCTVYDIAEYVPEERK